MPRLKKGKWPVLAIAALIILLLICIHATAGSRDRLSLAERGFRDLMAPLQSGAISVSENLRDGSSAKKLAEENAALKEQVSALQEALMDQKELAAENKRLRLLLAYTETLDESWEPSVARVIGRNTDNWYHTITIKGGSNKGYRTNMPVVNSDGLVGRISSVSRFTSEVMLLYDSDCAVACLLEESRTPGVVEGELSASGDATLAMIHIPYGVEVMPGETVISSGLGEIFPAGIRIGSIVEVGSGAGDVMHRATVDPFVDFDRLEEVIVLMTGTGEGEE